MARVRMPAEAEPVAAWLRTVAPRPDPAEFRQTGPALWPTHRTIQCLCPLGMCPSATRFEPVNRKELGHLAPRKLRDKHVRAIWLWWDREQDVAAAIEAVWGTT